MSISSLASPVRRIDGVFPTCEPNGIVGPVYPKTMLVLLTAAEERRTWLEAPTEIAMELQHPLPDGEMKEVARGQRRELIRSLWQLFPSA